MILIFGTGQLGNAVAEQLTKKGVIFTQIGRDKCDVSQRDQIAKILKVFGRDIRGVINCTAFTNVDAAESEHRTNWEVNACAPMMISEALTWACPQAWGVHVSTDYVFGAGGKGPWYDDDMRNPVNSYGRAKAAGECGFLFGHGVRHHKRHIVRLQNLSSPTRGIVSRFLHFAQGGQTPNIERNSILLPTCAELAAHAVLLAPSLKKAILHYAPNDCVTVEGLWQYVSGGLAYHLQDAIARPAARNPSSILAVSTEYPGSMICSWKTHVDLMMGRAQLG